jgi:hypothetical protein
MKRLLFTLITILVLTSVTAQQAESQQAAAQQAAEITFSYTKLSGSASNQFAIWIENTQGQYIKTLYATRYTANGGWSRRPSSIPLWVKQSGLSDMTSSQVDAVSGATPKAGTLTYTWDGTNSRGAAVPAGDYVIILEGTLRWENQVYYRAPIRLGQGQAASTVTVEYKGDAGDDRAMIKDVKVRTLR